MCQKLDFDLSLKLLNDSNENNNVQKTLQMKTLYSFVQTSYRKNKFIRTQTSQFFIPQNLCL